MLSAEQVSLIDADDKIVDVMTLPPLYMEGVTPRVVVVMGRRFVEGGGLNSFYGKGQFIEEQPK